MPEDTPKRKTLDDDILGGAESTAPRPRAPARRTFLMPGDTPETSPADSHATRPRDPGEHAPRPVADAPSPQRQSDFYDLKAATDSAARGPTFKVGLLGGKGVGKSYLFQSMVYRARGGHPGALACFLPRENIRIYGRRYSSVADGAMLDSPFRAVSTDAFIKEYVNWQRLGTTLRSTQMWYRVHLPLRTGWLGRRRSEIELSFLDGSGEQLEGGIRSEQDKRLWKEAFVDASVMVFCLPMWAAFPNRAGDGLTDAEWLQRQSFLSGFHAVMLHYQELRLACQATHPVLAIIALTQADSPLCEQETQRAWITPYVRNPAHYLRRLKEGSGVTRYLASARATSRHLATMCEESSEGDVSSLLNLDFGYGPPWLIPVTAIDGHQLTRLEERGATDLERMRLGQPAPAHVELPLLVALSDHYNALA